MIVSRTYYFFKPYMPWRLRFALRRLRAKYKRATHANVWPIDPKAGAIPPGWPGWPEGKRFAFVLTHDVEGNKGLARVERLMRLELKQGFRSSFNFVPEGEYRVPDELRHTLGQRRFEVAVHGLEHDGRLYTSKPSFALKAAKIRAYLRTWNAAGFRSPYMQHKLGWLHELNTDYDASTFDTDPFEPEPDGVGTIFPFWVPGTNRGGYVELPYTLVQDFSLFLILRERDNGVWKKKIDWIAEHGGMALMNTHPDYMCFDGDPARDEFPVSYYEEFLHYVRAKYEGAYWHALPRDIARFYRDSVPVASRNSRKKVCMVACTGYTADSRVQCQAETLANRGDQVDVIALNESNEPGVEEITGVTLHRIQPCTKAHKRTRFWRRFQFLLSSSILLSRLHRQTRYDLVYVYDVPNWLVFAAWYPKLTGAKIILDVHDPVSKFEPGLRAAYVGLLKVVERMSARFVDHVTVSNVGHHDWDQKKKDYLDLIDSLSTECFDDVRLPNPASPVTSTTGRTNGIEM